jgi:hypothetical protein
MSDSRNEAFGRLIKSLSLRDIRPMKLLSERRGDPPAPESEVQLSWSQSFAKDDPVSLREDAMIFRPRYQFTMRHGDNDIFFHESVFIVAFSITDRKAFDEGWTSQELRDVFMNNQVQRTMWPFLRQQVHDAMSKVGLIPVPLPWIP